MQLFSFSRGGGLADSAVAHVSISFFSLPGFLLQFCMATLMTRHHIMIQQMLMYTEELNLLLAGVN